MANLTASWVASGKYGNAVVVSDFVARTGSSLKPFVTDLSHGFARFLFASPPQSAKNVVVVVEEEILDLNGRRIPPPTSPELPGGPSKEFHGRIENGSFVASKLVSGDLTKHRNNEFRLTGPEGKNTIRASIRDPERVSSHTLTLTISYDVAGRSEKFVGQAKLNVRFPLAMVVPKGTATLDTALNMIPRYASHWRSMEPDFRHVEGTPIVVTRNIKGDLQPSHFDGIVASLRAAALNATAGVIALSVGHGGTGGQPGTSFFNLVPEDNRRAVTGIGFRCAITQTDLVTSDTPPTGNVKFTPDRDTRVRLDALDRIADALEGTPIRRLILHTCNAGNDDAFIQLVANRLRVPVQAQKDFIFFEPQASYYEKDKSATLPRDEKFWPVHRLGSLKIPKKTPPPRFKV